jgi:ATP-dependent DNA helicase PIF1
VRYGAQTDAQMKKILLPPDESSVSCDIRDRDSPVRIFCLNREVNRRNRECFRELRSSRDVVESHYDAEASTPEIPLMREMVYTCATVGDARAASRVIPRRLPLCVGARVMLLRNIDVQGGLVNGTTGIVVGFRDMAQEIETEGGSNCASSDIGGFMLCGSDGNSIGKNGSGSDSKNSKENRPEAFQMQYRDFKSDTLKTLSTTEVFPVVKFKGVDKPVLVRPAIWQQKSGGVVASKLMQLPLRHAWAITAHKAQGLTFDKVHVDLAGAFESGQAYVALSRARSIKNLRIVGYDPKAIKACPVAVGFHKNGGKYVAAEAKGPKKN